jgi:hypothetical protein
MVKFHTCLHIPHDQPLHATNARHKVPGRQFNDALTAPTCPGHALFFTSKIDKQALSPVPDKTCLVHKQQYNRTQVQ